MRCENCRQLLDDFIDGELAGTKSRDVEQHIRECSACSQEVEFLRRLSRDAASLPKHIQPGKDLWPGIEAAIREVPGPKSGAYERKGRDLESKWGRRRAAAWGWRVAAAAMFVSFLLAGAYLVLRKYTAEDPKQATISNALEKNASDIKGSPSSGSLDNRPDTVAQDKTGIPIGPNTQTFGDHPPIGMSYQIDLLARVFVSNYGFYAVSQDRDPSSSEFGRNSILAFDQNGTQEWIPPLPPGSTLLSVYPGGGNRLWVSYKVEEPEFQIAIAELEFGIDSQVRNVWTSNDLNIRGFVVGPQGLIYAAGFQNDYSRIVPQLIEGQSITAELLHIINPMTGEERHLFPIAIRPQLNSQLGTDQTVQEMTNLANETVISVKSNGNFFVTMDKAAALTSVRDVTKNEAVEYNSDGTVATRWSLGSLEPDAYLNKIFVDIDDSILAEIVRFADADVSDLPNGTMIERYLLRIDPNDKVTRYDPDIYYGEVIQGWMGQTGELITVIGEEWLHVNRYKLSF